MWQEVLDSSLNERERVIALQRLMGSSTLDELGQVFGVTRERVRQIERKLKWKLSVYLADVGEARSA